MNGIGEGAEGVAVPAAPAAAAATEDGGVDVGRLDRVQVFLVDDEPAVTDALLWLLESVRIRARSFTSPAAFIRALGQCRAPACAVIDLRMPEMSGLELQQTLIDQGLSLPILFLTAHGDVPAAVHAMQAGAVDFIQKPFNPNQFLASVRKAIRLAADGWEVRHHREELDRQLSALSGRERDVLQSLLDGRTSKEIGRALSISPKTVDVHRANVMRKMGARTRTELVQRVGGSAGAGAGAVAPGTDTSDRSGS